MRKVYVCSPLRAFGSVQRENNVRKAKEYCSMVEALYDVVLAVAPHAILARVLSDDVPEERELALDFGLKLLGVCEAMFVCGTYVSEGMEGEIAKAVELKKPIYVQELSLLAKVKDIAWKHGDGYVVKTIYEMIYKGARQ